MIYYYNILYKNSISITYMCFVFLWASILVGCTKADVSNLEYPSARFVLGYIHDESNRPIQNKNKTIKGLPELSGLFKRLDLVGTTTILSSRRSGVGKTLPEGPLPTTIVIFRSIPKEPVQLPQATEGVAIYQEDDGEFKLVFSECKFGSKNVELKPYDDGRGNQGVTCKFYAGLSQPGMSIPILWAE